VHRPTINMPSHQCPYCDFSSDNYNTFSSHRRRKHPEHKVAPVHVPKPASSRMQSAGRIDDVVDKALAETRLAGWRVLWEKMMSPPLHAEIPSSKDVYDMCEAAYKNLPEDWKFYHLICSPDVASYGPDIVTVGMFSAKCMCNILQNWEPTVENLEKFITEGTEYCHEHWIVAMKSKKNDSAHRHRYMARWFGKGNARLLQLKDKNHFLNTVLYIRGAQASNGVNCHNHGVGLSQQEKMQIRNDVIKMDSSYLCKRGKLSRMYKKSGKVTKEPHYAKKDKKRPMADDVLAALARNKDKETPKTSQEVAAPPNSDADETPGPSMPTLTGKALAMKYHLANTEDIYSSDDDEDHDIFELL
jgi:hypothetical protein